MIIFGFIQVSAGRPPHRPMRPTRTRYAYPVEALLFDLGNVLIEIDFGRALAHWAKFSTLSLEALRATFGPDEAYERHERGELQATDYFAHLRAKLRLDATDRQIEEGWNAIFAGEITASLAAVRATRLPRHLLTNSNQTHYAYWRKRFASTVEGFGHTFESSTIGHRKPEQKLFDHVTRTLDLRPQQILFFDDLEENIAGARQAGLQTVHVRTPQDVQDALERLR